MWGLETVDGFQRSFRKFAKQHRREAINAIDNLEAYLDALNDFGLTLQQIERGFLHHEPHGIKAIDESGPGAHKKATRLYIYPDEATETLFQIIIGDKDSQSRDIDFCRQFVLELLKRRESDRMSETEDGNGDQ